MSSNTELEGDGMEVQAHEGAHKHVENLLEATGELSNCFVKNVVEAGQNLRSWDKGCYSQNVQWWCLK